MGTFIRGAGDLRLGAKPAGIGAAPSSLLTGLVSYWTMNETSGTRADSTGTNPLTDNNTVAGSAGKIGNAADFILANLEFLSKADTDGSLDGGDIDLSYSVWFKTTSTAAFNVILTKSNYADHGLDIINTGSIRWEFNGFQRSASSAVGFNDGNWHHVICWHEAATGILSMVIDNGSTISTVAMVSYVTNNDPFTVGGNGVGAVLDGSIDELGRWSKVLTSTERTNLWNAGAGRTYPFS